MFPFDIEDDEIEPAVGEKKEPADYEVDFLTGKLTGRVLTGLDAIKQWVRIVLSTDRYYFPQYSWEHGAELSSLIGKSYDDAYIKSEAKRMIEDAIMVDGNILGIENLEYSIEKDVLKISFILNTVYGRSEMHV